MNLPDDPELDIISGCCHEYITSKVPEECLTIHITGSEYDGWYSVETESLNQRHVWSMGNSQLYWVSDTIGNHFETFHSN